MSGRLVPRARGIRLSTGAVQRIRESGQEAVVEVCVVGDRQVGPEGLHGVQHAGQGLGGVGLHVTGREVMHGRGGRGRTPRVDQAGEERPQCIVLSGGRVDADADGGEFDDGVPGGVETGGLDVDGEGVKLRT